MSHVNRPTWDVDPVIAEHLGRLAHAAYVQAWLPFDFDGTCETSWDALIDTERAAWIASAVACARAGLQLAGAVESLTAATLGKVGQRSS